MTKFCNCGYTKPHLPVHALWAQVTGERKKVTMFQLLFQGEDSDSAQGDRSSTATQEKSSFRYNGPIQRQVKRNPLRKEITIRFSNNKTKINRT
jgi:hypothetical protein